MMFDFFKKIPLSALILISLLLGLVFGYIMLVFELDFFVKNWVSPFGIIFLNLLKLIAVPIVFLSIICGIFGVGSIKDFKGMAGKTMLLYVLTTLIAISVGLILVNTIKPGKVFDKQEQFHLQEKYSTTIESRGEAAKNLEQQSPLNFLVEMVPENIFQASSDNSKMLQIIFVAILIGIVILILPSEKTFVVQQFFSQLSDIFIKLVDIIMKIAPIGVFALMASMIVDFGGSIGIVKALGMYALTVVFGLVLVTFVIYFFVVKFFTKIKPFDFYRGIFPAQLVAFTTSSSAATLPVTKRQLEQELKVSPKISGFVLPIGMTINMDGTSLYQVVAVVFISQVFGIEMSISQQMLIVLMALLSSIGAPGIPGGSIVMLVFILSSVGIPIEGLALIIGIDRPLDMLRTVTNVTGDSVVCCLQMNNK